MQQKIIETFDLRKATMFVDENGKVWGSASTWQMVIKVPRGCEQRLALLIESECIKAEREDKQKYSFVNVDGETYYRWPAQRAGLRKWKDGIVIKKNAGTWSADEQYLYRNLGALDRWGARLEEEALAGQSSVLMAANKGDSWVGPVSRIAEVFGMAIESLHNGQVLSIERIDALEKKVFVDENEIVSVEAWCQENNKPAREGFAGRTEARSVTVGRYLASSGVERGPKVAWCPVGIKSTMVNSYRRKDIKAAYERLENETPLALPFHE